MKTPLSAVVSAAAQSTDGNAGPGRETIRLLHVEDVAADAELIWRELSRAGLSIEPARVEGEGAFLDMMESFRPDIVLSDFSLPHFDGMRALELAGKHAPGIPVIIVTGSQNEETA